MVRPTVADSDDTADKPTGLHQLTDERIHSEAAKIWSARHITGRTEEFARRIEAIVRKDAKCREIHGLAAIRTEEYERGRKDERERAAGIARFHIDCQEHLDNENRAECPKEIADAILRGED